LLVSFAACRDKAWACWGYNMMFDEIPQNGFTFEVEFYQQEKVLCVRFYILSHRNEDMKQLRLYEKSERLLTQPLFSNL